MVFCLLFKTYPIINSWIFKFLYVECYKRPTLSGYWLIFKWDGQSSIQELISKPRSWGSSHRSIMLGYKNAAFKPWDESLKWWWCECHKSLGLSSLDIHWFLDDLIIPWSKIHIWVLSLAEVKWISFYLLFLDGIGWTWILRKNLQLVKRPWSSSLLLYSLHNIFIWTTIF